MTAAAGIVSDLSLLHALQPEQLIARLPPEYYVVLPEVNANYFGSTVTDFDALEHVQMLDGNLLYVLSCLLCLCLGGC